MEEEQKETKNSKWSIIRYCDDANVEAAKAYFHQRGYELTTLAKINGKKSSFSKSQTFTTDECGFGVGSKDEDFISTNALTFTQALDDDQFDEAIEMMDACGCFEIKVALYDAKIAKYQKMIHRRDWSTTKKARTVTLMLYILLFAMLITFWVVDIIGVFRQSDLPEAVYILYNIASYLSYFLFAAVLNLILFCGLKPISAVVRKHLVEKSDDLEEFKGHLEKEVERLPAEAERLWDSKK
jgi:hypothetical protein